MGIPKHCTCGYRPCMFQAIMGSSDEFMSSFEPLILVGDHATANAANRVTREEIWNAAPRMAVAWPEGTWSGTLLERVGSEAINSDLIWGERPELWSPAGALRPDSLGGWWADEQLFTAITGEPAPITASALLPNSSPILTLNGADARSTAALAFGGDSFILPVPAGTEWVEVDTNPETP